VNTQKFSEAQEWYSAGEYRKSARLFLDAVEKGTPVGNGLAYHMAGNSFMHLKRYSDAIVVFEHALRDDTYSRRGAVEANLASAYVREEDYNSAIAHYESALALGDEKNAYRYYQGTAQVYMKQGEFELAAVAFKHAALNPFNPTPGKTLLNLGLAMMASGSAKGAIEAYQAALSSPDYENKGRAMLNMGIAYHSLSKWQEAIDALEDARKQPGYQESEMARTTLEDAKYRLSLEAHVAAADETIKAQESVHEEETIDPVEAYMRGIPLDSGEPKGAGEANEAVTAPVVGHDDLDSADRDRPSLESDDAPGASASAGGDLYPQREVKVGNAEDVERFFAISDQEAAMQSKIELKKERSKFFWVKWALIIIVLVGGIGGGGAGLYFSGQGFPSAETTVTNLLESYATGHSISQYWTFDTQAEIEERMIVVPIPENFIVYNVDSGPSLTTVNVSVTASNGDIMFFTFHLVREGIGWKVDEIVTEGINIYLSDEMEIEEYTYE